MQASEMLADAGKDATTGLGFPFEGPFGAL
jgi:hypothetical protein